MINPRTVAAIALFAVSSMPATADTLLLDAINASPANNETGVARPARGATMVGVTAQFGDPDSSMPAVGEPPITRWVYPTYTVYFEHDRVINVVVHR